MMNRASISVAATLVLVVLVGCRSTAHQEPTSDYVEMRPLIYDYGLVFDCVAEAISEEGLPVDKADRSTGEIETKFVKGTEDLVRSIATGSRVHAFVVKQGQKDFIVRLAASKLERELTSGSPGDWTYAGRDDELLERVRKRFDKQVEKRYKPADKG